MKRKPLLFLLLFALLAPWAANAQNQLNEGFESTTFPPQDWVTIHVSGSNYWQRYTTYKHSGDASAYAHWASAGHENYLVTPQLMPKANEALTFFVAAQSYSGTTLKIELSTTKATAASFTTVLATYTTGSSGTIGTTSPSTWVEKTIPATDLAAYVGQKIYIAFHVIDSNGGDVLVDDVTGVSIYVPDYPKPGDPQVTGTDHESASFLWTAPSAGPNTLTDYAYQYKLASETAWPTSWTNTNSTDTTLTIHGLRASSNYNFRLVALYGDHASDTVSTDFATTAQATVVGDSWSDDFEGDACGWQLINGTLTNKWCWGTAANNGGTHALYVSNDNGVTNAYTVNSAAMVYATKFLSFTEGKYEFSFDWRANGEGSGNYIYDFLRVALVPTSVTLTAGTSLPSGFTAFALPTGWIAVDGGSYLNGVNTWQSNSATINVTAGNYYLVMAWRDDTSSGSQPPAAVDNVSITRVLCPYDVTGLAVSNITTTSATITWTDGDPGEWQVATKAGDGEWTTLANTYTTNSATLSLTPATSYQVKVRAYCSPEANNQGQWCTPISFDSKCEALTITDENVFFENFDSIQGVTSGTVNNLPMCWSYINTTTYSSYKGYPVVYNASGVSHSINNHLRFYSYIYANSSTNYDPQDQYAILPAIDNLSGLRLKLYARAYNTGNNYDATFHVGVMTNPDDVSTFVEIGNGYTPEGTTYELFTIPFDSYTGAGTYIAIKMEAAVEPTSGAFYRSVYIDDITVEPVPACLEPTGLAEVPNTATLSKLTFDWTAGGTETTWKLQYKKASATEWTTHDTPVTTKPYELTGLDHSTTYNVRVAAWCTPTDPEGISGYCEPVSANRDWVDFTEFQWYDDFERFSSGDFSAPCWVNERIQDGTGSGSLYIFKIATSTSIGNSTKMLQLPDMKAGTLTKLVFPEMTLPGDDYQFVLDVYRNTNSKPTEGIRVYVSTDGELAGATELAFISRDYTVSDNGLIPAETATGWYTYELPLGISGTCYIILRGESQWGSATYLDNFAVEQIPTCARPSNLKCSAKTAHTAKLSWTNGAESQNAWQIAYSTNANFNPDEVTPVDVTHNPDTLTGLDANTTYYAYVRANCGNNDYSQWCRTYVTFKTNVGNATPTLTVDQSSITYNSAKVTWTAVATNELHESYELYYSQLSTMPDPLQADSLITGITDLNYVFTRLNPETKYYVWLRDNCGTDGLSNWSSSKNFTTLSACVAPNNLTCLNTTTSSATLRWFERGDATEWVLTYMTERDTIDVRVDENPYTLTGLADGTDYSVKVRPTCSETAWSSVVSFTTPALCPAPTNLTVNDITGHTATMNWVGTSNSYIVTWGINNPVEQLKVDFSDGIPTDWTNDTIYPWTVVDGYIKSGNAGVHNSTSAISLTMTFSVDGTIEFDAECMGEGTSTYWDHCDFYIDGTRKLYHGADLGSGWNHYSFDVTAGEHTFTWSYTKDSSQHPTGDYFAVDNVKVSLTNMVWDEPVTVQDTVYNFSGLSPETLYYVKLVGDCVSDSLSAEVNTTFTTTVACPAPTDLHYVDTTLTAHEVMLSWTETGLASEWQICVNDDMDNLIPADTTTFMLTNLDQDTDYSVKVRANCGDEDGTSTWSNVLTFHTLVTCAVPTNLAADSITTSSALLSWNGTSDSYVLQYMPWHQVGDDQVSTAEMTTYTYDLSEYSGTGSIAIRHYDVTNMFYLIVDDIEVTNAQGDTIFSENFESTISSALSIMDLDGDGYNWELLDSDSYYLVNDNYGVGSASYTNNVGPLTPDNWLIISGIELGGQISFAARGQDAEWPAENFGVFVSADSDYTEVTVNDTTKYLAENLMPNTPYAWQVKGVCGEDESHWAASFFTTLDDVIVFTTDGNWNEASNWTPATVPTSENNVRIEADAIIPTGVLAEANKVTIDGGSVTIKDGGQMKQNSATLQVTMEKVIAGYGEGNGNYYLIASPFSGRTLYSSTQTDWNHVDSLFNGSYDLYTFDPANGEGEEWVNYKEYPSHINYQSETQGNAGLLDKEGYLYANEDGVTLTFIGNIGKNINITENKAIAYEANKGWALVGNIFACNAYLSFVDGEGEVMEANYWVMNATGDDLELAETTDGIAPITAAFVNFGADGYVQINSEEPTRYHRTGKFSINLSQDGNMVDKAVVRFGKGLNLEKMSFKNNSKLYFSMKDKDYAVVYTMKQGEMPVSFNAEKEGTYTIDFSAENVNFSYLVLVDNETGEKIDLIANPSYTFETVAGEFARRFTIVYETK